MANTPLSTLLTCPRDGGGNTGMKLYSARIVCGASPTITTDNGFATVTRNGAGDYSVTFDPAFASAPHCWGSAEGSADSWNVQLYAQPTTGGARFLIIDDAGTTEDATAIHVFAYGV